MLDELELDADDGDDDSWFSWGGGSGRTLSSGAIFLLSLVLLFWNETSSKATADALAEAGSRVREISGTTLDPTAEGQPVHISATVSSQSGAADPQFALRSTGVAIYRHVQMYQWIEHKETHGRGKRRRTEYYYEMDWDWRYHDSSRFHEPRGHENPKPRLNSEGFFAEDAKLGPYLFKSEAVLKEALWDMDSEDPGSLGRWPKYRNDLPDLPAQLTNKGWFQAAADEYYLGDQSVEDVELGDLSVSFYEFPTNYPLSLIAMQRGRQLQPWKASNGEEVLIARSGSEGAAEMVRGAIASNGGATSFLRLIGVIGAMLGMAGMAGAISGLLSMVPVLGPLLNVSLRLVGALVGLVLGVFTMVLGWLWARPVIALTLLVLVVGLIVWAIKQRQAQLSQQRQQERIARMSEFARQRAAAGPPPPPPPAGSPSTATAAAQSAAAVSGPPPPPPPSAPAASPSARVVAGASDPGTDGEEPKDLPPLEWTPGLSSLKPPSVRPRNGDGSPLYNASEPDPIPGSAGPPLFEPVVPREPPPAPAMATQERPAGPAPTADQARLVRRALGKRGEYVVNLILRILPGGDEEVVCFELMHGGKPIKRGSQGEIRLALQQLPANP